MRALILFAILLLAVSGAYLFHQARFGPLQAASRQGSTLGGKELPGLPGDLVIEIGGGEPPLLPASGQPEAEPAAEEPVPLRPSAQPTQPEAEPRPSVPPGEVTPEAAPKDSKKEPEKRLDPGKVPFRKGSSLYALAKKHYGSGDAKVIRDIASANKIADVTKIKEGAVLTLPPVAGGRKRKE
ncbi:MAG: LysM peptidoglycan-binding domain-containing protein [Planctomycetes bacterium]|nr:LysM peptidoglycan-binding domain-containing protein [Planctomycetota bacterium]